MSPYLAPNLDLPNDAGLRSCRLCGLAILWPPLAEQYEGRLGRHWLQGHLLLTTESITKSSKHGSQKYYLQHA